MAKPRRHKCCQSNKNLFFECFVKTKMFFSLEHSNKNSLIKNDSNKNIDKYFNNIDPNYLNYDKFIYPSDICNICNNGELIFVDSEGMTICSNCSNSIKYLIDRDKPSYKEHFFRWFFIRWFFIFNQILHIF